MTNLDKQREALELEHFKNNKRTQYSAADFHDGFSACEKILSERIGELTKQSVKVYHAVYIAWNYLEDIRDDSEPVDGYFYEVYTLLTNTLKNKSVDNPLQARIEKLEAALKESKDCWDAAYSEGFPEAMNEARSGDATRLIDLLDRRLLYALAPIVEALGSGEDE